MSPLSPALENLAATLNFYNESGAENKLTALVTGEFGTGKTTVAATAPAPILIDSFDPGGSKSIRNKVRSASNPEGTVIVDNRYELEPDPKAQATVYKLWEREFEARRKAGVFAEIGTYVIDSLTTFSEALMNAILRSRKGGYGNGVPDQQSYLIQMMTLRDIIKACTALPCNFILISHLEATKDELTGAISRELLVTGKFKYQLPLLFDEIYVAEYRNGEAKLLLRSEGQYRARSRLAGTENLQTREPADIFKLMEKAGLKPANKTLAL